MSFISDAIFAQTIEINLGDKKVLEVNDTLTLKCSHPDTTDPRTYTWFFNSKFSPFSIIL